MGAARHILIVSDDPVMRDLLGGYVEGEGFRVSKAREPHAALARCRKRCPEVVLIDAIVTAPWTRRLLDTLAYEPFDRPPRVGLLVGGGTPDPVLSHPLVSGALAAPFTSEALGILLADLVRRRERVTPPSGTRLRAAGPTGAGSEDPKPRRTGRS